MSVSLLTTYPSPTKCYICGKPVEDGKAAVILFTDVYTYVASQAEVDEGFAETTEPEVHADLDWNEQVLAHVDCIMRTKHLGEPK